MEEQKNNQRMKWNYLEKITILDISVYFIKSALIELDNCANVTVLDKYPLLCDTPSDVLYEFIVNDLSYAPIGFIYNVDTEQFNFDNIEYLLKEYLEDVQK